jgi:hypothetical protein
VGAAHGGGRVDAAGVYHAVAVTTADTNHHTKHMRSITHTIITVCFVWLVRDSCRGLLCAVDLSLPVYSPAFSTLRYIYDNQVHVYYDVIILHDHYIECN